MSGFVDGLLRLRRGAWEMVASLIIALGVFMLMQPFALGLYTWGRGYDADDARETAVQMTVGPLAAALLDLDRLRGIDVSTYDSNRALFNSSYRDRAAQLVDNVLSGVGADDTMLEEICRKQVLK